LRGKKKLQKKNKHTTYLDDALAAPDFCIL
jgi:hypothetical protein